MHRNGTCIIFTHVHVHVYACCVRAIPTGSVPHWLDFKKGDFHKSTAFKSYGVKTKQTSQYVNEHGSDSARFEHGGGSRSNTKGEYVVLACQKHYLPT